MTRIARRLMARLAPMRSASSTGTSANDLAPAAPEPLGRSASPGILDSYLATAPSPQAAIDIFAGEWSSELPESLNCRAGGSRLFNDARIRWMLENGGAVQGRSVLELGPLEAGHSYLLEQAGASEITAIEANSRAYLKCLIVKELLGLKRIRFLYGDFVEYLRSTPCRFDLAVASGVLYHMQNPVELIALLSRVTDRLFVWTHHYDESVIRASPVLSARCSEGIESEYRGFKHTLYVQHYGAALDWAGFCGGAHVNSAWMSRDDILSCVRHFGLSDIKIAFDAPDHQNGPSFAFLAVRPIAPED